MINRIKKVPLNNPVACLGLVATQNLAEKYGPSPIWGMFTPLLGGDLLITVGANDFTFDTYFQQGKQREQEEHMLLGLQGM